MSKLFKTLLGFILTISLSPAYSCSENEKDCPVAKEDWIGYMKEIMPSSFCSADSPFIKCSDVSQVECREVASRAIEKCIADYSQTLPSLLNKEDAIKGGETLGDCMGDNLFNTIELKLDKDASCNEYLNPN